MSTPPAARFPLARLPRAILLAAVVSPFGIATATATAHHHRAASAVTHVVQLSSRPGTALETTARTLAAHDIADSVAHHDQPLVLVGSAALATRPHASPALFVQLQSASLCGSAGCQTSVYLPSDGGWDKVLDSVSGPVAVLASSHRHMHDLLVGEHDRWVWDGRQYADTLPAPALTGLRRSVERHQAIVARDGGQSPPP